MSIHHKKIERLPRIDAVQEGDLLAVSHNGTAAAADASLFRGEPAKINGNNTIVIRAGPHMTLDQSGNILTIDTPLYDTATTTEPGLMSSDDKQKLDGIPADATNNLGTITGVTMNGVSKGTSGVVNLGTVLTEHQDISGKVDKTTTVNNKALSSNITLTASDVGLGNVPNVTTNNQAPTYTVASTLAALVSGEKISVAFGKLAKAIADLISHLADSVRHITAAERTAWNNKVDSREGMGLSANSYTTAEKTKLADIEAGAQVNEVTAEQHNANIAKINALKIENASLQKRLENLLAGLEVPVYRSITGTGVIDIPDCATGPIMSITVDKSLAGKTLYIQRSDLNGLLDVSGVIDSDGVAAVSLATTKGGNRLYITTGNYTFPPSGNGHGPHTGGTYVNYHTDENGKRAYDTWIPNGGVEATVRYIRDAELGENVDKEISWEDFLSMVGLGVNYVQAESVAAAITAKNAGKEIYAKIDGYPFGTQAKPTYSQCDPSQGTCLVYYIAEYYRLTS